MSDKSMVGTQSLIPVPVLADEKLIRYRPEDLLLVKLDQIQKKKLMARRIAELEKTEKNLIKYFISLADSYCGLSQDQLMSLPPNQQVALANLLFKKIKIMAVFEMFMIPFLVWIPAIGWFILGTAGNLHYGVQSFKFRIREHSYVQSYYYYKHFKYFRKLKLMCGEKNCFRMSY